MGNPVKPELSPPWKCWWDLSCDQQQVAYSQTHALQPWWAGFPEEAASQAQPPEVTLYQAWLLQWLHLMLIVHF